MKTFLMLVTGCLIRANSYANDFLKYNGDDETQFAEEQLQPKRIAEFNYFANIPGGVGDCYTSFNCQGSPFARQVSAEWCSQSIGAGSFYNRNLASCYNF